MVWTDYFNYSPNPSIFDPNTDWEKLYSYEGTQLEDLLNSVVRKLNEEVKLINPTAYYDVSAVRNLYIQTSGQNWDSLDNNAKFYNIVRTGETILNQAKGDTIHTTKVNDFYKKYYFRLPTQAELDAVQKSPYGLGASTQTQLKSNAADYLASYGIINGEEYEGLTDEQKAQKLDSFANSITQIRDTALKLNNNLIDGDKVSMSPIDAIGALIKLKDEGVIKLGSNNTYAYVDGKSINDLASLDDGKWLTSYQKLEKAWKDSGSAQTFSEYLVQQQAFRAETDRVSIDSYSPYGQSVFNTLGSELAEKIANEVGSPEAKLNEIQQKIERLKTDAYNQAFNQLNVYKNREEQQKIMDQTFGDSIKGMTTQIAQDFGLKSDFFKVGGLNSSVTYSWQKWFEDELSKRYDPNYSGNKIASVLGDASPEDISIASGFMKDYLQKRFDGSKSLSEFTSYIQPGQSTPVLEKESGAIWNQYSSDNYYSLLGSITDPNSNLGNFWTLLKNNWAQGQGFDTNFYKNQTVIDANQKQQTIEEFWNGIKAINAVAVDKNTTDLSTSDFDNTIYAITKTSNTTELNNKIQEFRKWWNEAFANGSDINSIDQFMKMHYNVYTKQLNSANRLVQTTPGAVLKVSDGSGIITGDQEKIQNMAERLAYEATKYMDQIKFGEFIPPEEYVQKLMGDNSIFEMFKGSALDSASELDVIKEFNNEFASTLSSYAGEQIRERIRELIANNKKPGQGDLGIEYIERSKAEALATIQNIIKNQAESSAVIVNNINAPYAGQSLSEWFRNLGLEIVSGSTWAEFKAQNNIPSLMTLEQWEKSYMSQQYSSTGEQLSQVFWEKWAVDNGVNMTVTNGKVNMVVENPSSAWKTWSSNIIDGVSKSNTAIVEALRGASVNLKTDQLNKTWYSKTNPYTKVIDGWKSAVRNPGSKVIDVNASNLWKWAKENQINTDEAWNIYKQEQRTRNPKFAKDAAGDDFSFEEWAQSQTTTELDKFWKSSSPYWVKYLVDKGIADPTSTSTDVKIKSWGSWAQSKNIDLNQYNYSNIKDGAVPSDYLDLHYSTLGGRAKVNEAYLDTYFPEFKILENQESSGPGAMFDLSAFGLDSIKTGKDDLLNDFNTFDPFKSISGDFGFDVTNPMSVDNYDSKNTQNITGDVQFNFDVTSSYNKKKNTSFLEDFDSMGFGDFGGASFGF